MARMAGDTDTPAHSGSVGSHHAHPYCKKYKIICPSVPGERIPNSADQLQFASHDRVPSEKTATKEWIVETGNCQ